MGGWVMVMFAVTVALSTVARGGAAHARDRAPAVYGSSRGAICLDACLHVGDRSEDGAAEGHRDAHERARSGGRVCGTRPNS